VVEVADGWFPRARNFDRILAGIQELEQRAAKAGRDMKRISVSVFGAPGDAEVLDRYRKAPGITRAILRVPSEPRDKVLPLLDQFAKLL
jgi:hypothetical protein